MKYVMTLAAVALLASACAIKTERTVVTQPVATTDTVVSPSGYTTTTTTYQEPISSTSTTRIVPR